MSTSKTCDVLVQTPALSLEATFNCDDILIEILLRVPARSLIRLKCVCKHWLNLISSPSFCHDHTCRISYLISGFYFCTGYKSIYSVLLNAQQCVPTLSFLYGVLCTYAFYIEDSCNGLILCSDRNRLLYSVSNPTTQKYNVILPPPAKNGIIRLSCLAFDPTRSIHYRVLIIRQDDTGLYEIDMYFSGDKSWKRVYAKGKRCRYFGECGGDLLLVEACSYNRMRYRIHKMRKGNRYWKLKQWVRIRTEESDFHVLSVMKRSHLSDMELVLADTRNIYSYNTKLKKMEVLYNSYSLSTLETPKRRPSNVVHYFIERLYPV